jgi:phenylacetate-CoA ligase
LGKNNWFCHEKIINLRKPFSRNFLRFFDLSLRFNGYDISGARQYLKQMQLTNPEQRKDAIAQLKQEIVHYHLQHTPFYRNELLQDFNGDWDTVPIMTKRHLQRPLEQRLSSQYRRKDLYINKTSGSTGDPFIFAKDKWCHALTWALIMDRFQWYGIDFNSSKQARFYGIPLDGVGRKKERLKDRLAHRYRFSVFDLSDAAFELCLKKFKARPFDYINGYTSPIVQFAKFLKKKGLVLKALCPSLKVCMVTSEMLFEEDRYLMESSFGIPVVNEYGASELDLIAFENPTGEWQLNNESLFIEIVDDRGRPVANGTEGRIVITSLFNKAHPFIRYDIGDRGIIDANAKHEYPVLKTLIGRSDDLIQLPSGKTAAGLTFYYVTKSVIEESGEVKEFVIEQKTRSQFLISYVSERELREDQKKMIRSEIIKYLEPELTIHFERRAFLERSKSGKLKQFNSCI